MTVSAQQSVNGTDFTESALDSDSQFEQTFFNYYQPGRDEALLDEARQALTFGRYGEAEELLDQAFQINRASYGLFNPAQLPILDQLISTHLLQGKWEEFDQKLNYVNWLHLQINRGNTEELAAGLLWQSDWHRAAAASINDLQSAWYLIQGKYLNWRAVSLLEQRFGPMDTRVTPGLYRIVLDHFYQTVNNERRGMTSFDFKTDSKSIANGWSSSRNETVGRSYGIGKENLERIRAIYSAQPNASSVTDALLQIQLADWEFLYGNTREALNQYQAAYHRLIQSGISEDEVERFFSQAKVLPEQELQLEWSTPIAFDNESTVDFHAWSTVYPTARKPVGLVTETGLNSPRALVELNLELSIDSDLSVTDYVVAGMNVFETSPQESELVTRAFQEIPYLKFRPRLIDGELANHDSVVINYYFAEN